MRRRASLSVLAMLALAGLALSGCGQEAPTATAGPAASPSPTPSTQDEAREASYTTITQAQLRAMLENKDFLLVNVHIPYEGEILQTDLFAPYKEMEQYLSELPQDRSEPVVLYCRYGPMSVYAANTLVSLGFTNVYILEGGFSEWERPGAEAGNMTPSGSTPRIHFDQDSVDLGRMSASSAQDYTFVLRNVGDGPLELRDVRVVALEGC